MNSSKFGSEINQINQKNILFANNIFKTYLSQTIFLNFVFSVRVLLKL